MAKVQVPQLALRWDRSPGGEFFIEVAIPKRTPAGELDFHSLYLFLLSKEEVASLKAALSGLMVAKTLGG